jgi:phage terminase small subunit
MGKLTTKRIAFVEHYLSCWNATEAARRAGYKEKWLHTNASKLLQDTTIQELIKARVTEMCMGSDEVLTRLAEIARNQSDVSVNSLRALELVGKHHRLFVDVKEIMDTTESPADRMARLRDAGFRMHPDGNVDQES